MALNTLQIRRILALKPWKLPSQSCLRFDNKYISSNRFLVGKNFEIVDHLWVLFAVFAIHRHVTTFPMTSYLEKYNLPIPVLLRSVDDCKTLLIFNIAKYFRYINHVLFNKFRKKMLIYSGFHSKHLVRKFGVKLGIKVHCAQTMTFHIL